MNIIHIYGDIDRMHGATKWLLLFASKLEDKGHTNTILCQSFSIPLPYWFKARIKPLFNKKKKRPNQSYILKLLSIISQYAVMLIIPLYVKKEPTVFVLHAELSLLSLPLIKLRFKKSNVVYYCYQPPRELYDLKHYSIKTYGVLYFLLSPLFGLYKYLDRLLVKRSDVVLVWSEQYKEYASSIYGAMKFQIVPAGVNFDVFAVRDELIIQKIRKRYRLEGKKVLLMNASLIKKKNIPIFLRLINKLIQNQYQIHGLIIGEGPEREILLEMILALGITDHVTIAGYVSQEDLPAYYHCADILYYLEPDGAWTMSTIEAGAASIPVIVAPGGSMAALVVDTSTGFILELNELEKDLFDKTLRLLEHPDLSKTMGEHNYKHSLQFSVDAIVDHFAGLVS